MLNFSYHSCNNIQNENTHFKLMNKLQKGVKSMHIPLVLLLLLHFLFIIHLILIIALKEALAEIENLSAKRKIYI